MYDAIVFGVGGMGSAALYHLAKRGLKVLGIEQHTLGHTLGSSHGETRAIRRAYFEHPDYVPLALESCRLWRALEAEAHQDLFNQCGMVLAGQDDSELIAGSIRAAEAHGLDLEEHEPTAAELHYPGFLFDDEMTVLFEADAGFLRVEECVIAHQRLAVAQGAEILSPDRAVEWEADGQSVSVRTESSTHTARHLVLCAGPWSSQFLQGLDIPLSVDRVVSGWFAARGDSAYAVGAGSPVFGYDLGGEGFYYGFPSLDGQSVKVARHGATAIGINPDMLDRELRADDLEDVKRFIARHMPGLTRTVLRHSVCMYTMTRSKHFVVDTHPGYPNVHLACGFSGHGFKFAPVVGAVLADLVERGKTERTVEFLSLRAHKATGDTAQDECG